MPNCRCCGLGPSAGSCPPSSVRPPGWCWGPGLAVPRTSSSPQKKGGGPGGARIPALTPKKAHPGPGGGVGSRGGGAAVVAVRAEHPLGGERGPGCCCGSAAPGIEGGCCGGVHLPGEWHFGGSIAWGGCCPPPNIRVLRCWETNACGRAVGCVLQGTAGHQRWAPRDEALARAAARPRVPPSCI